MASIHLEFTRCKKITDIGLYHLGKAFKALNSLEKLYLEFSWCDLSSEAGLKSIFRSLKNLTSLEDLNITIDKSFYSLLKNLIFEGQGS